MTALFTEEGLVRVYTRAQAIKDGVLVDVDALVPDDLVSFAVQAGWRMPVALTAAATALVKPTDEEGKRGQDLKGRLWDVLCMAYCYARRARVDLGHTDTVQFPSDFPGERTVWLKAVVSGGDQGESVLTISLPDED